MIQNSYEDRRFYSAGRVLLCRGQKIEYRNRHEVAFSCSQIQFSNPGLTQLFQKESVLSFNFLQFINIMSCIIIIIA